jgi:hypothetical protein
LKSVASSHMKGFQKAAGKFIIKFHKFVQFSSFHKSVHIATRGFKNPFVITLAAFSKIGKISEQFHRSHFRINIQILQNKIH